LVGNQLPSTAGHLKALLDASKSVTVRVTRHFSPTLGQVRCNA